VLLVICGFIGVILGVLSIAGVVKTGFFYPSDISPNVVNISFIVTFVIAYTILISRPSLAKSRRAILDGKRREIYVTENDFSYQMFFSFMPTVKDLTPIEIRKMFTDGAMVVADTEIRRHDLDNYYGLDVRHHKQHTVLYLIQAMYVSQDLLTEEVREAIKLQHQIVNHVIVQNAQRALGRIDFQQQSLISLVAEIESESAQV
jgi:hypothetical protein